MQFVVCVLFIWSNRFTEFFRKRHMIFCSLVFFIFQPLTVFCMRYVLEMSQELNDFDDCREIPTRRAWL